MNGAVNHTATDYYYTTNKTNVVDKAVIDNDDMVIWKDMYSKGFSSIDLAAISGVGVYITSFNVPESWDFNANGLILDLGYLESMVGVEVNGAYLWPCLPSEVTKPYEPYRHGHGGVMRGIPPICTNLTKH